MGGVLDAKHEHGVEHSVTFDGCTWTLITAYRHFKMFESLLKHTICAEMIYFEMFATPKIAMFSHLPVFVLHIGKQNVLLGQCACFGKPRMF